MYNKISPIEIVHEYLENGSLRKTASKYNIHYQTLFKWVKYYKNGEKDRLILGYKPHKKRTSYRIEQRIISLKELFPFMTLRQTQNMLKKQGIEISIKGIWSVWKRYGYTGFDAKRLDKLFINAIEWSEEARKKYRKSKELFLKGEIKKSANILNSIPVLPPNTLIYKIPDKLLNFRRRMEKILSLSNKEPISTYIKKTRGIYNEAKTKKLFYSSLRIGLVYAIALMLNGNIEEANKVFKELNKILDTRKKRIPRELYYIKVNTLIGIARYCIEKLRVREAFNIAHICEKLIKNKKNIPPSICYDYSTLILTLEKHKKTENWIKGYLNKLKKPQRKISETNLYFYIYLPKMNFKKSLEYFKKIKEENPLKVRFKTWYYLIQGKPEKAIHSAIRNIKVSKKENMIYNIFNSGIALSTIYASIGEKQKAIKIINDLIKLANNNKIKRYSELLKIFKYKEIRNSEIHLLSTIKLFKILKEQGYKKAYLFAQKNGILLYFYRYLIFFPEIVYKRIRQGKFTYIPKSLFRLPVFNEEIPVFYVRFLGKLKVYRSIRGKNKGEGKKVLIKLNLTPKQKALLIHIALRLPEPGRTLSLDKICKNFFPNSKNPSKNLSQILSTIRKQLKIPGHLLEISKKENYRILKNNGIYFTTDYTEFKEKFIRAKALFNINEYKLAEKELKSALKLKRGKPFVKMYDRWSEDKRTEILFEIEELQRIIKQLKSKH